MITRELRPNFTMPALLIALLLLTAIQAVNAAPSQHDTDKKCFVELPSGSTVVSQTAEETVAIWPDGSRHAYSLSEGNCSATEGYEATINGYIESVSSTASVSYTSLQDQWSVVPAPSNQNGAIGGNLIFFFDAIQDSTPVIFQPILAWGCQFATAGVCTHGGGFWWISATICSVSTCSYTPVIGVNAGDTMVGQISWQTVVNCVGPVYFTGYKVTVTDQTTGLSATLYGCSGGGTLALSAAFEAHNINSCNQLPSATSLTFSGVGTNPSSNWSGSLTSGLTPWCSFANPTSSPTSATVYWSYS